MPETDPLPAAGTPVPEGFAPLDFGGAYFRALGPLHSRRLDDGGLLVALRIDERHLNIQGFAHGGMLATLADGVLGLNIAIARRQRGAHVTVSMTADYLSSARLGDWLEARVTITRLGRRMAYANCDLHVGSRHVLRSSAVFAFVDRPLQGDAATATLPDG
jgi:uncharacterized protein (TIGR00369 family)